MSDNTELTTTEDQTEDYSEAPVVSGPANSDVKSINAVGDDHPLVQETGDSALETQTESGAGEFLSDFIYEEDSAWVREWLQNEETACVRWGRLLVKLSGQYPEGWLTMEMWVDKETGETVIPHDSDQSPLADFEDDPTELRKIEIPRPIGDVLDASRNLGYDPTIVWDIYRDEREIVTEDNGIGMTTAEFDNAFNTIFSSGSGVDGDTGGMFGVGSESSALVHGNEGGAEVETRSRRPGNHDAFRAYSYLGGANALPGEVEEGFYGTKFIIPVQDGFNISNLQGWVENYADMLRVPLLYREHDAGTTPVEEEYEATRFRNEYDTPIEVHRPGEFTVVAGPDAVDTSYRSDDEDTYMVSMPIDRNSSFSISTLWDVAIQIHDEQGRVVAGPHRGFYSDGTTVYETSEKKVEVASHHSDDIMLPEPTGDRDRLQKGSKTKDFFRHIEGLVKDREMEKGAAFVKKMKEADHPGHAVQADEDGDWELFKALMSYHGGYRIMKDATKVESFLNDEEAFPDFSKSEARQILALVSDVEVSKQPHHTNKRSRKEKKLGDVLQNNDPDDIYMAASTGGKFTQRYKVVRHNNSSSIVIVVNGTHKYEKWGDSFGFHTLKETPIRQDDDNELEVPDEIHQKNKKKVVDNSVPDDVKERELKIRTDSDNSSIDLRLTIEDAQDRLHNGGSFHGHDKLILFPGGSDYENISDHYKMSRYGAIASVSQKEYRKLENFDRVVTYEEYTEWSESGVIATEDGAMTAEELVEDDRMTILVYASSRTNDDERLLLADENKELRTKYAEDIRDQTSWANRLDGFEGGYRGKHTGAVFDEAKPDTLVAVAGDKVLNRVQYAIRKFCNYDDANLAGMKVGRYGYDGNSLNWKRLDGDAQKYQLQVETPDWDDSSKVYDLFPNTQNNWKTQALLGFHDRGVDPTEENVEDLREMVASE